MKIFTAVVPPREALDHLAAAVQPLRDERLRWARSSDWHITAAYYGEVEDSVLQELDGRIAAVADEHPGLNGQLAGGGTFGSGVLWMGVRGDLAELRQLAGSLAEAEARRGRGSGRGYRPHLTLARSSGRLDLRPYVAKLAAYTGPVWQADEVVVFRSHPPSRRGDGHEYEVLRRYPLGG